MKIKTRVGLGAMLMGILLAQAFSGVLLILPVGLGLIGFICLVWED